MTPQELNDQFLSDLPDTQPSIFKHKSPIIDDMRLLGVLSPEAVKFSEVAKYYSKASYNVKYLKRLIKIIDLLDQFTDKEQMYIWLPKDIVFPALIRLADDPQRVYCIAPRAVNFNDELVNWKGEVEKRKDDDE